MTQIRINTVHYNEALQAYEARIDVIREGAVFRYPCQLPGPVDMSLEHVAACLTHQALRMSDSAQRPRPI